MRAFDDGDSCPTWSATLLHLEENRLIFREMAKVAVGAAVCEIFECAAGGFKWSSGSVAECGVEHAVILHAAAAVALDGNVVTFASFHFAGFWLFADVNRLG